MKRRDLLRQLADLGCVLVRHGAKHDWYMNPQTRMSQPVPRHNEINEYLAKSIIRKLGG
jgi:predicted RNA binding protein YcfA (HicA-like mRNA interferase family)